MGGAMRADAIRAEIATLTDAAMCGDWEFGEAASVLRAMGRNTLQAKDVPGAMEMVALLQHFAPRVRVIDTPCLGEDGKDVELAQGIVWGDGKLLLLIEIPEGEFENIAYWVADTLPSSKIKAMPGVLALPFTIENAGEDGSGQRVLFPDWFAVFYPHGMAEHAFATLVLRSMLSHEALGGDWVDVAVGRMAYYALPREKAEKFVAKGTKAN